MAHSEYCDRNSKGLCMPTEIPLIFGKFEGYILSGIGSRSVPVDRQAGWLSDKNVISFEFFKIL